MKAVLDRFGCDLRSLAVFRLGLALAVMLDAVVTPGRLPMLAMLAAIPLLFGYFTRWATLACWLLVAVLRPTDPVLLAEANDLLATLLLLSIFLPLGACYSVDRALDAVNAPAPQTATPEPDDETQHVSIVTVALTGQVLLVLIIAALNSLAADADQAVIVQALNGLCLTAPIYVLLPLRSGWLRFTGIAALLAAWFAAAPYLPRSVPLLTLAISVVALLPPCLWEWLCRATALERRQELRIYFDQDCGFCRKTCYLFRTFFVLGDAQVIPAQSDADACEIMQREVTWVVYDYDDRAYTRWRAVILLLRRSPLLWPLGTVLHAIGMGHWGDPIYAVIAASRWWLSKVTRVLLPWRRVQTRTGRRVNLLAGVWLIVALVVAFVPENMLPTDEIYNLPRHALGLVQRWSLW